MKLKGEFILREIADEYILIPVGETALDLNGIISLNPVSAEIWKDVQSGKSREEMLANLLEHFEVTEEVAKQDLDEFLQQLQSAGFLG